MRHVNGLESVFRPASATYGMRVETPPLRVTRCSIRQRPSSQSVEKIQAVERRWVNLQSLECVGDRSHPPMLGALPPPRWHRKDVPGCRS